MLKETLRAVALVGALSAGFATHASTMFYATLIGDPRAENPDNLKINVAIEFLTATTAKWTVDINSPLHQGAKLDEFYFNMAGPAGQYSFGGFSPSDWTIKTPANEQGGGNINPTFVFEAYDSDPGGQNQHGPWVTNTNDLVFTMTKSSPFDVINFSDFFGAAQSCSSDTVLGCGRLGAHLQSLTVPAGSGLSDSGFLLGEYGRRPDEIPIPAAAWLLGSGLLAIGAVGRRRMKRHA